MCEISIIMPVYNKEKYIEKSIKSIVNQSFKDWELIIINDGSTDNSLKICSKFTDSRIKIITIKNDGVSNARNCGLSFAVGHYITFVDGDDYLDPNYLLNLYHPQYEMVLCGLTKVKENGDIVGKIVPNKSGERISQDIFKDFYNEQMNSGIYGFVAGKMIRKSLLEGNNIRFDINITLAEDFDFFINVYNKISNIFFIQSAGYFYLQDTENSGLLLDDSKIDFFTQIEIQNKVKRMLSSKNSFSEEDERIYLKRVTNYVYTILLRGKNLGYASFQEYVVRLKKIVPEVSLETKGFMKVVMYSYRKDRRILLFSLLKIKKYGEKLIWKQ